MFFNFFIFSSIFKSVESPASGKENVRFWDSPDFEILPDFRTGRPILGTKAYLLFMTLKHEPFNLNRTSKIWVPWIMTILIKEKHFFRLLVMKLWRMSQFPQPKPPRFKNWSPRMAHMRPNLPLIQVQAISYVNY